MFSVNSPHFLRVICVKMGVNLIYEVMKKIFPFCFQCVSSSDFNWISLHLSSKNHWSRLDTQHEYLANAHAWEIAKDDQSNKLLLNGFFWSTLTKTLSLFSLFCHLFFVCFSVTVSPFISFPHFLSLTLFLSFLFSFLFSFFLVLLHSMKWVPSISCMRKMKESNFAHI